MKIFKHWHFASLVTYFVLLFAVLIPVVSSAEQCNFTRDLELETVGDDVVCLQKYLNTSGFAISSSGVGSAGHETNQFKSLTKKALIDWQLANGVTPASGYFGSVSRQKYLKLIVGVSEQTVSSDIAAEIKAKLVSLTSQLEEAKKEKEKASLAASVSSDSDTRKAIESALEKINKAEDQIDEAIDDGKSVTDANSDIKKSRGYFFDALTTYFDGNFSETIKLLDKSERYSDDAIESAGGETTETKTESYLNDVQDILDETEDQIDDADDDGRNVEEARNIFEEAQVLLDQASDKFDGNDFNKANALARDAEDRAYDSLDSIGDTTRTEANNAINKAQNAIINAQDKINDADKDDSGLEQAKNFFNQAENKIDNAQDEYSDGYYDEALDLAEDALDFANDAKNR